VQSIHPEGHINPNECIYCMHCQELYRAEDRCPHNIQRRLKREKQIAMSAVPLPGGAGAGGAPKAGGAPPRTRITRNGKPARDDVAPSPAGAPGP
jgi:NosR/NirI family nitrous oxide reductase transcriptional regulator